jgi:hypothetical protein
MTTTPQTPADEALGNGDGRMADGELTRTKRERMSQLKAEHEARADAQQGPLRNPTS